MNFSYLLECENNFSLHQKKAEIIKKENFINSDINEYDLEETFLDNILESLDTYSFLAEKKVVIIKNIELLNSNDKNIEHFFKYLKNPDKSKLLIMLATTLDSRKKITKDLKVNAKYIKVDSDANTIIKNELKDYQISNEAIRLILEYTNNQIDAIKTECDKLKQYKFDDKKIDQEDIKKVCFKHQSDTTNLSYDLTKYISSKNKKEAIITYKKLHEYNIDDVSIIGLLESQLRLLYQTNLLLSQNKTKKEIASILDIHPYRIEKTIELLHQISFEEIKKLLKELGEIDYKVKSGIYETKNSLEMLILNL